MFGPLIELIDCQSVYNILNEGIEFSKVSDRYYLYLLDCRPRADYNESHIISAKNVKRNDDEQKSFRLPYEAELESCNMVVIYDSNTSNLNDNGPAMECAKLFSDNGSKFSVKILKGGYELFSKYYPFLRSQQIIFMPKELDELRTYPSEIIPGLLYLGNNWHGTQAYIKKDLKLKAYLDCSNIPNKTHEEKSLRYLKIPIEDEQDSSLEPYLDDIVAFLDLNVKNLKQPCLVYSKWGLSRSAAAIIAYLVVSDHLTVQEAFDRVSRCRKIQPQISFLEQIQDKYLKTSQEASSQDAAKK